MNRTDRLMAIILLLRSRRKLTAQQLAEIFEVSTRTIYRDIDALCQARVPIAAEAGPEGGYMLLDTYSLPPVMFTPDEAAALFLGGNFVAHCQGIPFQEALKTALIKIEDILPAELQESVHVTSESILFDGIYQQDWRGTEVVFEVVNQALLQHKCVQMAYHSARKDTTTQRVVAPYGLIYDGRNGAWYLVGFCHLRNAQRMFHLARIQAISLTDRDFQVPAGFDLTSLANRGWARSFTESLKEDHQPIRIKARKEVSERLRRDWFFRYAEREEAADGKVILTYYDHLPSAPYLPCRFGADCEVLEPQELREQMIAHARKVLALYGA